jgi:hypothetical protein
MAFDTAAVANELVTILSGLTGLTTTGAVKIGAPESVAPRLSAYVTIGSQSSAPKTTGTTYRDARYFVNLAYRVDGAEATAETTLMGVVDAFLAALYADLTLGGTCGKIEIDTGLADTPDYQHIAGKEYREYPIIVTARQYGTYTVNP